jgi:hypothetical protein
MFVGEHNFPPQVAEYVQSFTEFNLQAFFHTPKAVYKRLNVQPHVASEPHTR